MYVYIVPAERALTGSLLNSCGEFLWKFSEADLVMVSFTFNTDTASFYTVLNVLYSSPVSFNSLHH